MHFITGNADKFVEAQKIIPKLVQLDIDLEEIQELDSKKIIEHKLKQARNIHKGELIVEDTSLFIDELGMLPGPFIKWFEKSLGINGIYDLVRRYDDDKATVVCTVGFLDPQDNISFFEGITKGRIVPPKGKNGFGWDPIFEVEDIKKTYAEMDFDEKQGYNHRTKALKIFSDFLKNA